MGLRLLLPALASVAMAQPFPGDRTITSEAPVSLVTFVEGGKTVAALCGDGKLRLWDARSGAPRQTQGKERITMPAVFLSRADQFATVARDGSVQMWDARTASVLRQLPPILPRASRLAFSADGSRMATAHMLNVQTSVNTIKVHDAAGKELISAPAGLGGISILGFSPDGATLVAGSYDADLRVWSVRNNELVQLIDTLPVSMFALSFSPDGNWLATAGVDRTVYLWDTKSWKLARKITGQPEMISALQFSPDGKRLVTGGFSEVTAAKPVQLILWDVGTAKQLRIMPAPHRVAAVVFSPDGRQIASSSSDQSVNLWQVPD
jgi:WD40 repeat protein